MFHEANKPARKMSQSSSPERMIMAQQTSGDKTTLDSLNQSHVIEHNRWWVKTSGQEAAVPQHPSD